MKEKAYLFEVETHYKSGRIRTDILCADTEKEMWEVYDKHHNSEKVKASVIVDCWMQ